MYCPLKFTKPEYLPDGTPIGGEWGCEQSNCAWWEAITGRCCMAVDAYLKGQEDWRREKETIRRGG